MNPRSAFGGIVLALLAAGLRAQVPSEERIPITDPDRLEGMGFPRDAKSVFVWSRANLGTSATLSPDRTESPETWGTERNGFSTVTGRMLQPTFPDTKLLRSTYTTCEDTLSFTGGAWAWAQIQVPEGASLESFKFWANDSDPDKDMIFRVWETCGGVGLEDPTADTLLLETGTLGAVGAFNGGGSLNGHSAANDVCAYSVEVQYAHLGDQCSDDFGVAKLRFVWKRQVSPAPAAATFNDVPTDHQFFQFVEALAKSEITGGCGNGNYCPDAPVTRGQMAVFLAKALGLQWP